MEAERIESELRNVTAALDRVDRFVSRRDDIPLLLAELARAIPDSTALLSLRIDSVETSLSVLTPRAADVIVELANVERVVSPRIVGLGRTRRWSPNAARARDDPLSQAKPMTNRDRRTLILGAGAIACLFTVAKGVPRIVDWERDRAIASARANQLLAEASVDPRELRAARDSLAARRRRLVAIDSALPVAVTASEAVARLASTLGDLADSCSVRVSAIQLATGQRDVERNHRGLRAPERRRGRGRPRVVAPRDRRLGESARRPGTLRYRARADGAAEQG